MTLSREASNHVISQSFDEGGGGRVLVDESVSELDRAGDYDFLRVLS